MSTRDRDRDRDKKKVKPGEVQLQEKMVALNRVAKVVKGGRRFSFTAIVVVGDGNGVVGHGLGKASEVANAIAKGFEDAKKNLVTVPIINGTVPHEIEVRYGAAKILLKPAAPGTGILAGGAMRAVLESAGIKDVLGKTHGSSNPHNVVKATILALSSMRDAYTVAKVRGIPLEKVFTGF
jgi:small subunit ribosomal protein S5